MATSWYKCDLMPLWKERTINNLIFDFSRFYHHFIITIIKITLITINFRTNDQNNKKNRFWVKVDFRVDRTSYCCYHNLRYK